MALAHVVGPARLERGGQDVRRQQQLERERQVAREAKPDLAEAAVRGLPPAAIRPAAMITTLAASMTVFTPSTASPRTALIRSMLFLPPLSEDARPEQQLD